MAARSPGGPAPAAPGGIALGGLRDGTLHLPHPTSPCAPGREGVPTHSPLPSPVLSISPVVENKGLETSLVVQWLKFSHANAGDVGSIPGGGTEISHALQAKKKSNKGLGS